MNEMTQNDKMLSRRDGGIGYLIFNNPERHNAVSLDMWEAATRILDDFARDDTVRVVVVTGAGGKAFVSGADISALRRRAVERGGDRPLQRGGRCRQCGVLRLSQADHRDDPRLLHRRRPRARGVLRPAHLHRQVALRGAGREARAGLRLYRDQEAVRPGRAVLRQGDLLHRAPVRCRRRRERWGWSTACSPTPSSRTT